MSLNPFDESESKISDVEENVSHIETIRASNPFDDGHEVEADYVVKKPEKPLRTHMSSKRPISAEVDLQEVYEYSEKVTNVPKPINIRSNTDDYGNPFTNDDDGAVFHRSPPGKPIRRLSSPVNPPPEPIRIKNTNPIISKARKLSLHEYRAHQGAAELPQTRAVPSHERIVDNGQTNDSPETENLSDRRSFPRILPPPAPTLYVEERQEASLNRNSSNRFLAFRPHTPVGSNNISSNQFCDQGEEESKSSQPSSSKSIMSRIRLPSILPSRESTYQYQRSQVDEINNDNHQPSIITNPTNPSGRGRQLTPMELETAQKRLTVNLEDENAVIRFLLKGRVYGFPGSHGNIFLNYMYFTLNNHPLISIFCAHPKNPFSRKKRIIVFFCSLCFTFLVAYVLIEAYYINQVATCREGCDSQNVQQSNGTIVKECVGGANDGLTYTEYQEHCKYYNSWLLSFATGLFTTVYSSFLRFLATCGCFQGRTFFQENCVGKTVYDVADFFGGGILMNFILISFGMLIGTILECWLSGIGFGIFVTTIIAKLWSFLFWFGWTAPFFIFRYPRDKKYFKEKQIRKAERQNSILNTA